MSTYDAADAAPPVPTATLPGMVTGAFAALAAMGVYQLVRIGFWIHATTSAPNGGGVLDRFVGLQLLPSLLSLGPSLLSGAAVGGLVGLVVTLSWDRQGPIRAAVTGALVTAAVAGLINLVILTRQRRTPLTFEHWRVLIGFPSAIYIVLFAVVGRWLYVSRARQVESG